MRAVLFGVIPLLGACAHAPRAPGAACAGFSAAVEAFNASLIRPADAPPRSDPQRSPPLATAMVRHAAECLSERGIAFDAREDELRVTGAGVAREVSVLTGGTVVYSAAFFLERPYAAAAFDKARNLLFLPHQAISSDVTPPALKHELEHVRSLRQLRAGARWRHLVLENASTRPNALQVDEIFAYATVAADVSVDAAARANSLQQARYYSGLVRDALEATDTVAHVELQPPAEAKALTPDEKRALAELVRCVDAHLPALDGCDTPR